MECVNNTGSPLHQARVIIKSQPWHQSSRAHQIQSPDSSLCFVGVGGIMIIMSCLCILGRVLMDRRGKSWPQDTRTSTHPIQTFQLKSTGLFKNLSIIRIISIDSDVHLLEINLRIRYYFRPTLSSGVDMSVCQLWDVWNILTVEKVSVSSQSTFTCSLPPAWPANQRQASWSRDHSQLIRGQEPDQPPTQCSGGHSGQKSETAPQIIHLFWNHEQTF